MKNKRQPDCKKKKILVNKCNCMMVEDGYKNQWLRIFLLKK